MSPDSPQAKGGRTRASRLSAGSRKEIAAKAAEARWGFALPQATHSGDLVVGNRSITCAVLQNGKRVLTQGTFLAAIGIPQKTKSRAVGLRLIEGLPEFLVEENLRSFLTDDLKQSTTPIVFRNLESLRSVGYDALLLPLVCELYLKVRDQGKLYNSQKPIATACDALTKGLKDGIIASVDEVTGYQEQRAMEELMHIIDTYLEKDYRGWTPLFPRNFFREIYRISGWARKPGTAKNSVFVKHLIKDHVFGHLPEEVLEDLRRLRSSENQRRLRWSDFAADTGNTYLDQQIAMLTTLMKISDDQKELDRYLVKMFGASPAKFRERSPLAITGDSNEQP